MNAQVAESEVVGRCEPLRTDPETAIVYHLSNNPPPQDEVSHAPNLTFGLFVRLHPTSNTPYHTPYTLHPTLYTINPQPETLNAQHSTLSPES